MYNDEKGQKIQTLEKVVRILIEGCWHNLSEVSKNRIEELTGVNFSSYIPSNKWR